MSKQAVSRWTLFRNLLVLAGPIFLGVAGERVLYGAAPVRVLPFAVVGVLVLLVLPRRGIGMPLLLLGGAAFGVAGLIAGLRQLPGQLTAALIARLVVSGVAVILVLAVARRSRELGPDGAGRATEQ